MSLCQGAWLLVQLEEQRGRDDGDAAHGHGECGHPGRQQLMGEGVQGARGYGDGHLRQWGNIQWSTDKARQGGLSRTANA